MPYPLLLALCLLAVGEPSGGAATTLKRTRRSAPQGSDPAMLEDIMLLVNKTTGEIVMAAPETPGETVVMHCPEELGYKLMCQGVGELAKDVHRQRFCTGHCRSNQTFECTPDRCFCACLKVRCRQMRVAMDTWCKDQCFTSFEMCPYRDDCHCFIDGRCSCPTPFEVRSA